MGALRRESKLMKKSFLQIALIVSVAFNLAALAAVVYGYASASGKKPNAFTVYDQLHLTGEQKKVLSERYVDMIRRITGAQKSYATKWAEVVDLIAQPQPDWAAIEAKQAEILAVNRETQTMIFQRWDWAKTQLTPEQQRIFFDLLRQRIKSGEVLGEIKTAQELLRQQAPSRQP